MTKRDGAKGRREREIKKINKLLVKQKDYGATCMSTSKPPSLPHEFTERVKGVF